MERRIIALLSCLLGVGIGWAREPSPVDPYTVFVASPEAWVYCGPSVDYYRTDDLQPAQELEVYVETEDGWLGVRPPDTSFSWIPERQVKLSSDRMSAVVDDPKAVAWVGTNLGTAKTYRWQVRLSQGEQLAVLGEFERETKTGEKETWLKIVPPAGEFRWIHVRDIAKTKEGADQRIAANRKKNSPAEEDVQVASGESRGTKRTMTELEAAFADDPAVAEPTNVVAQTSFDEPVGSGVKNSLRSVLPQEISLSPNVQVQNSGQSNIALASASQPMPPVTSQVAPNSGMTDPWEQGRRGPSIPAPPLDLAAVRTADVSDLQLMLARQMAGNADASVMEPLRERANWWVQNGVDPVERGRAGLMVDRIDRYVQVAKQKAQANGIPAATPAADGTSDGAPKQFDQRGYLVQVYSARPEAPPFAITDRRGTTIAYVAPAPGLNLRRYLNQEVGLFGRTGYLTGLDTPYLMVERVVALGDTRR